MKATLMVVFGVISLVLLGMGIYEFFMQRRLLANAQPVQVTITDSGVRISRGVSTDNDTGAANDSYEPQVKFTYELGGTSYESTLLRPIAHGRLYGSYDTATAELTPFPVRARVQAFVSPNYPDKAYLLRESSRVPLILIMIGVAIPLFIMAVIKLCKL